MGGNKVIMQQWEYLVRGPRTNTRYTLEYWLNSMGKEGWELCGQDGVKVIFKRPKQ